METLWYYVGQFPMWLVGAVVGGGTVALGYGLLYLFTGKKKPGGFARFMPVIGMVIVISIINGYRDHEDKNPIDSVMNAFNEQPLLQAIFKYDAGSKAELRASLDELLKKYPKGEAVDRGKIVITQFINQRMMKYLVSAPSDVSYKLVKHENEVLNGWRNQPELCIPYYFSDGTLDSTNLPRDFLDVELNLKAELVEAAAQHPVPAPPAPNINQLVAELSKAYEGLGYSLDDFGKTGEIRTLPPLEGCKLAIQFSDAIVSLGQTRGVSVYKALMVLAQQPQ